MRNAIFLALSVLILASATQGYTEISTCSILNSNGEYYKLTANINDNNASCMNITASNIILDCAGNTIDGIDSDDGVNVTNVDGVTIANCTITDWNNGIGVYNSSNSIFKNLSLSSSTYGLHVETGIDNRYYNITTTDNIEVGIYLNSYSVGSIIKNATITSERKLGIFVHSSNGCILDNITFSSCATDGIDPGHACLAVESNNTRVSNLLLSGSGSSGIYVISVAHNTFTNISLSGPFASTEVVLDDQSPNNTFINASFSTESVGNGAELIRRWVITVNVTENPPLSGATVTLRNRTGDLYDTGITDSNGIARFEVTEYKNDSGTTTRWTNYTAEVSKSGYTTNSTSFNFTSNKVVYITLTSVPSSPGGHDEDHEVELRLDKTTVRASPGANIELIVTLRNKGDFDESDIRVYLERLPEGWSYTSETVDLDEDEEKTVIIPLQIPISASGRYSMNVKLRNDENRDREIITFDVKSCRADVDCPGMFCEQGVCLSVECECGVVESGVCVPYECCADSDCLSSEKCLNHKCTVVEEPIPEPEPEPEEKPPEPEQPPEEAAGEEEGPAPEISVLPPAPKPKGEDYNSIILLLIAIVVILALVLISRPKKKIIRRIRKRIPRPRKRYAIEGPSRDEHQ